VVPIASGAEIRKVNRLFAADLFCENFQVPQKNGTAGSGRTIQATKDELETKKTQIKQDDRAAWADTSLGISAARRPGVLVNPAPSSDKSAAAYPAPIVAVPGTASVKRRSGCIVKAIAQPRSRSAIDTAKGKTQLPVRSTIRPKASGDTIAATADPVFHQS
jgi:hypothetical protein